MHSPQRDAMGDAIGSDHGAGDTVWVSARSSVFTVSSAATIVDVLAQHLARAATRLEHGRKRGGALAVCRERSRRHALRAHEELDVAR